MAEQYLGTLLAQIVDELAAKLAKVHIGADGHARGGELLCLFPPIHHEREPRGDLLRCIGKLHAVKGMVAFQGLIASAQIGGIGLSTDEAVMRTRWMNFSGEAITPRWARVDQHCFEISKASLIFKALETSTDPSARSGV